MLVRLFVISVQDCCQLKFRREVEGAPKRNDESVLCLEPLITPHDHLFWTCSNGKVLTGILYSIGIGLLVLNMVDKPTLHIKCFVSVHYA